MSDHPKAVPTAGELLHRAVDVVRAKQFVELWLSSYSAADQERAARQLADQFAAVAGSVASRLPPPPAPAGTGLRPHPLDDEAPPAPKAGTGAFQERVAPWMQACFGPEISADKIERNHRFLEEALELVQANGCMQAEAHQLVDYVYGRPVGEPHQEVGGVMVTLAALCLASDLNMHSAGEDELARIWTKVDVIRTKQASKPKHSPLPETAAPAASVSRCKKCGGPLEWHFALVCPKCDAVECKHEWDDTKPGVPFCKQCGKVKLVRRESTPTVPGDGRGERDGAEVLKHCGDDASKWAAEFRATAIKLLSPPRPRKRG